MLKRFRIILPILTLLLVLSSLILPFIKPSPVYAVTTQTLKVTGEGTNTDGTYTGGTTNWQNMLTNDGATSYIGFSDWSKYHDWTFQTYNGTEYINSVQVEGVLYDTSVPPNGTFRPYVRISGINYTGDTKSVTQQSSWQTLSYTWATNPATGLGWTTADINGATFGAVYNKNPLGGTLRNTYIVVKVNYNEVVIPTATTAVATSIDNDSATLNGEVTDIGYATIDQRGFVWGTSMKPDPGNVAPAASGYANSFTDLGAYGLGTFGTNTGATLTTLTTYYFRAYAHNSAGYDYGTELSFRTWGIPDITTQEATYINATAARVNALIVDDGEQASDVRFCYGTTSGNCTDGATGCTSGTCNGTTYNTCTTWVEDVYTTGSTPYVDLTGLNVATTYYFCSQVRNDIGCACGGELSFTTGAGVYVPSEFQGIPTSTTVSLWWVEGAGATNTLIRYKTGGYPSNITDGTQVYFDNKNSVVHTGLTRGTTYYYTAWGESGGLYSSTNATLMITTLAEADGTDDLPVPITPTNWFTAPDYTKASQIPFYEVVNWGADTYELPKSTAWYLIAMVFTAVVGIITYASTENHNLLISLAVSILVMGFLSRMGLIPLWNIIVLAVLAGVGLFVGERR